MEKYAKVVVRSNTFHTDNLFTYKIPEFLESQIYVGHRVLVPFGRGNKPTEAFVFKISDILEEDIKSRAQQSPWKIKLAEEMMNYTTNKGEVFCPFSYRLLKRRPIYHSGQCAYFSRSPDQVGSAVGT